MSDDRVAALEAENERLRDEIEMLREALISPDYMPLEFCLTGKEAAVLGHLLARDLGTKRSIMAALYAVHADGDEPEIKIVDVFVCKLRKKVLPFGIEIGTRWGEGYFLPPEMKVKLRGMMQVSSGRVAA